jgi:hypothetical protein
MQMLRRSRAWILALALAAAGLGTLPAASSAAPRQANCATINANIGNELGWVSYFTALSQAYYQEGNFFAGLSASADANDYANLAHSDMQLAARLGC